MPTQPIDRAALAYCRDQTLGYAGRRPPTCWECGTRLRRGAPARAYCYRHRAGRWHCDVFCPACAETIPAPAVGVDEFLVAGRIQAGRVGVTAHPPLVLGECTVIERALAGTGAHAGQDPATVGSDD